jgi:hypothetical protein
MVLSEGKLAYYTSKSAFDAGKPPLKGLYVPVKFYVLSPAVRCLVVPTIAPKACLHHSRMFSTLCRSHRRLCFFAFPCAGA